MKSIVTSSHQYDRLSLVREKAGAGVSPPSDPELGQDLECPVRLVLHHAGEGLLRGGDVEPTRHQQTIAELQPTGATV